MIKILKYILFCLAATSAQAQGIKLPDLSDAPEGPPMVMKTFIAELPQSPQAAAEELRGKIGHLVDISQVGGTVMAAFAGFEAPGPLRDYIETLVPSLNPSFLAADMPVSLSIALMPEEGMTVAQVMMAVPQSEHTVLFGAGVPAGGVILMDDAAPKDCRGQVVVAHPTPAPAAAATYAHALEAQGFTMQSASEESTSFFVGHRGDCALFLYTQPDFTTPDHTMVVVRFTED